MNDTRTVVTVHPLTHPEHDTVIDSAVRVIRRPDAEPVRYEGADDFDTTDGELIIWRAKHGCASWAPGTWARVEITEEPDQDRTAVDEAADCIAEAIARRHYDGLVSFDVSLSDGPTSLAAKLTAALDGLQA